VSTLLLRDTGAVLRQTPERKVETAINCSGAGSCDKTRMAPLPRWPTRTRAEHGRFSWMTKVGSGHITSQLGQALNRSSHFKEGQ
jgi:hypothetical protein